MGFLSELPLYGVRGSSSLCTPRLSLDVRTVHRGFIAPGIGWWPGGSLSVNPLPSGPPRLLRHFILPLFTKVPRRSVLGSSRLASADGTMRRDAVP
jgi:hypothetical protein